MLGTKMNFRHSGNNKVVESPSAKLPIQPGMITDSEELLHNFLIDAQSSVSIVMEKKISVSRWRLNW